MKELNYMIKFIFALNILFFVSCKKEFLDAKPSTSIVNPITLDDFQGLLEYNSIYSPGLPTLSADEYKFKNYSAYQTTFYLTERNAYIWKKDIFEGEILGRDWSSPYEGIFICNNVLLGVDKIKNETNIARLNFLKGWALFSRAFSYYDLISCFSSPYDESSATTDLGVPLKLNPSIDDIQPRATVKEVYDQIIDDLTHAEPLLGTNVEQAFRNHPSKVAVNALLARVYLNMRKYDLAEKYADNVLLINDKLIDYNSVSQSSIEPFNKTNDELIYRKIAPPSYGSIALYNNDFITINPELINLYSSNDLRTTLFFKTNADGSVIMKLSYPGTSSLTAFTGLATDEIYLIKAECAARREDLTTSSKWLNDLLTKRYRTGTFTPIIFTSSVDALAKVLLERRKELVWRNIRWSDLRRLNKEGANITLTRELNGVIYTLPPNDPRYIFPIPDNEIALSGIQQNQR